MHRVRGPRVELSGAERGVGGGAGDPEEAAWPRLGRSLGGARSAPPSRLGPGHAHCVRGGPGLLLLLALKGYTVENAWKNDVFFSWSYFSGWLALPFSILADPGQA